MTEPSSHAASNTSEITNDYYSQVRQANILSMRRYYAKNRDKELLRFKAYYQKNKEKIRAYKKRVREQTKVAVPTQHSNKSTSPQKPMDINFLCPKVETTNNTQTSKLDLSFLLN